MYFAMDEIGIENAVKIKTITSESDRWKFIYDTAMDYGFDGIHFTPSLYQIFDLDLRNIPDYFHDFKLTFHLGGMYIVPDDNFDEFNAKMENAFEIAVRHNMHDISIHPPYIHNLSAANKALSLKFLGKFIDRWLKKLLDNKISLSLETHVTGEYFLFSSLNEFVAFTDQYPDLGVLIDISHNYYEPQYSEDDIISILGSKNIKGLHISDALRSAEFEKGTHLAIGDGTIDFPKLLKGFEIFPNLYSVLEIKSKNSGIEKSLQKLREITKWYSKP
jgi:sugar phosphate isomerase/epimerase